MSEMDTCGGVKLRLHTSSTAAGAEEHYTNWRHQLCIWGKSVGLQNIFHDVRSKNDDTTAYSTPTPQQEEEAYDALVLATSLFHKHATHITLPSEATRTRVANLVLNTSPATGTEALKRLDERYCYAATEVNRKILQKRIDSLASSRRSFYFGPSSRRGCTPSGLRPSTG